VCVETNTISDLWSGFDVHGAYTGKKHCHGENGNVTYPWIGRDGDLICCGIPSWCHPGDPARHCGCCDCARFG